MSAHQLQAYEAALKEVQTHFHKELLPFWTERGPDREFGGFLTYFDKDGKATGETDKSFLSQARCIFTYAQLHRAGYGGGKYLDYANQGFDFVLKHFWDARHQGFYWITDRAGKPVNDTKIVYGHSFAIYGFAELALAGGDKRALEWAVKVFDLLQTHAADSARGGYYEMYERDWRLRPGGAYGGDRKTLDVHMHLMEAFTNLYAASRDDLHARKTREMVDLLLGKIYHPVFGTGIAQFAFDWEPLRAIIFKTVWGIDRDVSDPAGRPLDNTSYGHNVEFAWLLNWCLDTIGLNRVPYFEELTKLYDHCVAYGVDWKKGGVFCEGPNRGAARERNKEFWQQAEGMVGLLDACETFGPEKYWKAYENIHRFTLDVMVNHAVGEWWPLFDENNVRLYNHMSHAWKVNYHTVRAMVECEKRLKRLIAAAKK
ncbi:MAG: AGE family epimerase/isomerase [Planctomycetota bacterium]